MSPRALRPRATSAISVEPIAVTDLTCHVVLGLEARHFREWLIRKNVRHDIAGRRVIALVADCVEALRAAPAGLDRDQDPRSDDDTEITADSVLASIGMRRAG